MPQVAPDATTPAARPTRHSERPARAGDDVEVLIGWAEAGLGIVAVMAVAPWVRPARAGLSPLLRTTPLAEDTSRDISSEVFRAGWRKRGRPHGSRSR